MTGNSSWFVFMNGATAGFVTAFGDGRGDHRVTAYGTPVNDNKWHFIAWVRSSTMMQIYVDGVLWGTTSVTAGNVTNGLPIGIGAAYNDDNAQTVNGFVGLIDEVAFFDRSLSEAEIRAQYDATSRNPTAPVSGTPRIGVSGGIDKGTLNLDIRLSSFPDLTSIQVAVVRDGGQSYVVGPTAQIMTWHGPPEGGNYRIEARARTPPGSGQVLASTNITVFPRLGYSW